ncbi:efflux RND transporter permease subunit [Saccharophagus degradans]|uniref:Acriflavin resistance protein n=2 Tax=Saccharophagus degradans TaxID=86304 RepID=Q21LP9_SACD2|nr:efflux RND transporter permease subunit [Saccharophagus degradans]ABD80380.1 acriflavin resistance protein [Saccharophagus degradans 2-40]MBU2984412.1 efflux RND transporter permease subunit [Saccharophagus degradans]MDO6422822.1 efflux RND transporter permease subunit [Saccharophagus degradans]MDO6609243.1 efflux RND transporter permease subunit [Saccharophagus degradans]WGO97446.1 efflux RND transporter permease subunit [Saccharophagus degradans]
MKSITDIFVRKPVLAIVVNIIIIIAGLQAVSSLTVRQYPRNDNAVITINTAYIGADAELVRGFITSPIERAVSGADGIDYVSSSSSQGVSSVSVRLELNYDPIKALAEITSKVNQVRGDLPPEAEVPVINVESADSQFAAAYLSFSSDILADNQITDYLVRVVQPRLSALEGIQRADVLGARTFAMRIWLQPDRMAAHNISPTQVRQALQANNYLAALGSTKGQYIQVNLSANTDLNSVDEFKELVLRSENGAIIRLKDVAEVVLGSESYDMEVRYSGKTATFMGIFPQPNANSLDVMALVREEMKNMQAALPKGLDAVIAYDATAYIESSISEVISTLIETLLIVVVVIFLFLGSIRSVIIPVVAIPLSLIGAVFVMQIFGFSLNLLTLLAIVLSVGIVVDDAIVMVENVERHISEGQTPFKAAILGARELVGPVIAMTTTLVAVYLPIGLQGGLTGSLFKEFAFTLAGAVTISGIVAITLSPMMASKMLKEGMEDEGFASTVARIFDRVKNRYTRMLDHTLEHRFPVYMVWVATAILGVVFYMQSPKELAPTEDQGVIFGIVEGSASSTMDQASIFAAAANDAFSSFEETDFTFQLTFPNSGFGGMVLKPWDERERTVFDVLPEAGGKLSQIPGINLFPITPPALPGGGNMPVEFVIASTAEPEQILKFAQELQQKATMSGQFAFPPMIDTQIDLPKAELIIDRDKVADMGLNMQQVGADVGTMLGGGYVNRFNIAGRSYRVIPQVERIERLNPEQLGNIYVTGPEGKLVPLSTLARVERKTVARSLNRFQQLNAVKLSGVAIGPLDNALKVLEEEAAKILPQGYMIDYTGESRQLRREGNKLLPAMMMASLLIFLVLAAQFNSFRDPLIVLGGSVPLAWFGALIFTFLKMPNPNMHFWTDGWTTTLNIYSQIGLVTLIGLVAKNGILVVEFANKMQEQGLTKLAAIKESAGTRLRPVLMTTVATVAGHFPLVLVTGAGAEARNSIGLILVGGMAIGTFFTLFVIPSIYMLIAKDHRGEKFHVSEFELEDELIEEESKTTA